MDEIRKKGDLVLTKGDSLIGRLMEALE